MTAASTADVCETSKMEGRENKYTVAMTLIKSRISNTY
jgi:hypothetical protein